MKQCSKCKIDKDESEFNKRTDRACGLVSQCKECSNKHKKQYYLKNREKFLENQKNYGFQNKKSLNDYKKKYIKTRCSIDLCYKIKKNLRSRLSNALRGNFKQGSSIRDLGCSVNYLKKYLEDQFQPGMAWSNWGKKNKDENGFYLEIDHIIPFHKVDLNDEAQQLKVFHYTNLRPIWGWANLARNSHNDNEIDFSSPIPKYFEIRLEAQCDK